MRSGLQQTSLHHNGRDTVRRHHIADIGERHTGENGKDVAKEVQGKIRERKTIPLQSPFGTLCG